jgi:hypothetical protein
MPWKYNTTIIRAGKSWRDDNGITHPATWMRWTDAEKKAAGLVWEDAPASEAPFDNRFYWGRQTDGTLIPKSLTDINEVDDNGDAILDLDGNQLVTLGLKSVAIAQAKTTAAGLLAPYDWYVIRKSEKSTAIPSSITTFRDAVRTSCANIETAINAVDTHAKFMALYDDELNSDGTVKTVAAIRNWPDPI